MSLYNAAIKPIFMFCYIILRYMFCKDLQTVDIDVVLAIDVFLMRFQQFVFNFGSYFWLFIILTPLASDTKYAHLISAEVF